MIKSPNFLADFQRHIPIGVKRRELVAESPRPREVVVGLRATTAEASLDSPENCVSFFIGCWINPSNTPPKFNGWNLKI